MWVDADGDGFAEIGTIDTDGDGTTSYTVRDGTGMNDEDGTHDTLEFANGVTYHLDLGIEHVLQDFEFAGITRINLGSGPGERTLQIDDDVLSYMSDADFDGLVDSGYSLTIDGAVGDSVFVGDDQIQLAIDPSTPTGYVALRGTLVTIYVDSDITLLEPASSLQVDPDTSALDVSA